MRFVAKDPRKQHLAEIMTRMVEKSGLEEAAAEASIDLMLSGQCFLRTSDDGIVTRIDPSDVFYAVVSE